jgi:hypothetical protein
LQLGPVEGGPLQVQIGQQALLVAPLLGQPGDISPGEPYSVKWPAALPVIGIRGVPGMEHLLKFALALLVDGIAPLVAR